METDNTQTTEHSASTPDTNNSRRAQTKRGNSATVPMAILIGFGMIAAAIFFSGGNNNNPVVSVSDTESTNQVQQAKIGPIRPVDETDFIRGNPNAPIVIVEYSDFDCPFCKNFHETMNRIMDNYGTTGQVAWVYRHFPIEQLHPGSPRVSLAAECVAAQTGNEGFWTFADLAYGERTTNEPTNQTRLSEFAATAGADVTVFEACLESDELVANVEEDIADAIQSGANGTPHSMVLVAGQQGPIKGAQPYEVVNTIIQNILTQIEGGEIEIAEPSS